MAVTISFYFTMFLAIFVSLTGIHARSLSVRKNATDLDSAEVIVKDINYNAVNVYGDRDVKTALDKMQNKLESLEGRLDGMDKPVLKACKFDFEDGAISNKWVKTGTAFNNQPTYGDNSAARKSHLANQQGDWWVGTYENRPSNAAPAGRVQGDGPQGTLTSPFFTIKGKYIAFLIGGGCDMKIVRAELVIGNKAVRQATGKCRETMTRKFWDVGAYIGKTARVKLVDFSSGGWGHINFDDLKGDISCEPS